MKKHLLIFIFSIALTAMLRAQPLTGITYSVGEGLPQSQVFAVTQDYKGYMWFGTQGGGLGAFDGKGFRHYGKQQGLPSDYILALQEDSDKKLWVGTNKGTAYWKNKQWVNAQFDDNQLHSANCFVRRNDEKWILGSEKGVFEWNIQSQIWQKIKLNTDLDKAYINTFFSDERGVWTATNRGIFLMQANGNIQSFSFTNGINFQAISKDANGFYWLLSYNQGVFVLKNADLQIEKIIQHPDFDKSLCCFAAPDGKMWIGTENRGVFQLNLRDTTWKNIKEQDNLPSNHIRQIFQDTWNNIWICTSGGGVTKLLAQNFTHFNTKNGLPSDRIYAVAEGKDGKIWCATGNVGLMTYDGVSFQKPTRDSLLNNLKVKALKMEKSGRLWIGTEGDGLLLIDSVCNRKWTIENGLASNFIKSIVIDKNNQVWAATQNEGIIKITQKNGVQFAFETIKNLPDLFLSTLQCDNENRIWFATKNGILGYVENGKVAKIFKEENGIPKVAIRTIVFDNQGFIYVGTAGEGIFTANLRIPNLTFSPLKTPRYYPKNIYLLDFDKAGNLWSGSENGVDKIVFDAQFNVTDIQHFSKNEGFLGIETCQNAALCDNIGNLWFGTLNGLTRHLPNSEAIKISAPKIHIEQISLFYQPIEKTIFAPFLLPSGILKQGLELPYHQNHLSFAFKGIHLNSDAPMQYRWMLKGAESEWSPLSPLEAVNYAKLEPGDYVFMVQATTDGSTFSETIEVPFSIGKPFWQKLWFRAMMLGIVILSVWFFIKYREKQIKAKEAILREQLETKNKLLTLEQKALQLQMNPHFIFNVLTGIQGLIVKQKNEEARVQMSNFAQLMRNILSNSRKQLITLKEEVETLEGYMLLEQHNQKTPFHYYITFSEKIDKEELMLPPMLIQPFVENAILHGLSRLEKEGRIDINFDLKDDFLHCVVVDNGIGREKSEALKGLSPKKHQSAAIDITKERLDTMSPDTEMPKLQITDLKNKDGSAAGTKVELWIKIEMCY